MLYRKEERGEIMKEGKGGKEGRTDEVGCVERRKRGCMDEGTVG